MNLALCGNPNVGKTTVFNRLTGADESVGNWHGVTVGAKQKRIKGTNDRLTDLPGAYSLTAHSKDEEITRDAILYGDFDVVVCVAEVNDLRRNLYLVTQVLEAGKRAVLLVNMMDEAKGKVNLKKLSSALGIPIIGTSQKYKSPKDELLAAVKEAMSRPVVGVPYAPPRPTGERGLPQAFLSLKAEERDAHIINSSCKDCDRCGASCDRDRPSRLRYAFIDAALVGVIEKKSNPVTDRIDKIVLGRLALPVFFAVMTAVFVITFEAGKPLSAALSRLIDSASRAARNISAPEWTKSLISDGLISGVGAVLAFLPQVVLLFILTAILGDSGYMSRVAFVTDGFFKKLGLSGRSAFTLILGLGCSATAALSARGIADVSARKRTALVTPFLPCSARLAVFTAVSAYLNLSGLVVAGLYILGFFAATVVLLFMRVFFRSETEESLLMEMPPYRLPSLKRVLRTVYKNITSFIFRVGTAVLGVSVIIWLLCNFSVAYGFTGGAETSIMSTLAGFIAPVFKPLGFSNWRAVAALISGIAAKETVISVIASLGGFDAVFGSTTAAISFTIFTALYVPCIATLAALSGECGVKTAAISVLIHTAVAYAASFAFYGTATAVMENDVRFIVTLWTCVAIALACAIITAWIVQKTRLEKSREN